VLGEDFPGRVGDDELVAGLVAVPACAFTWSLSFDGLDLGRRDRGSSAAAGPSALARLRIS
jgi:hypothetical protein